MRLLALSGMFWIWAGAGLAQTVVVRGGEHEDFTRLVFRLPDRLDYEILRSEGEATITFDRDGLSWRTGTVFDLVPKTRLTDIAAEPGGDSVVLSLACDCEIDTFWYGRAYLVADIRNGPDDLGEQKDERGTDEDALEPIALPGPRAETAAQLVATALHDMQPAAVSAEPTNEQRKSAEALAESRDALVRQIGRAATQGLVSPKIKSMPAPVPDRARPEVAVDPEPAPTEEPARPNIHLRVETSIDRDMGGMLLSGLGPQAAKPCLDPSRLDVAAWGGEGRFHDLVGPLRARLVGEFDRPERSVVQALARAYIHFGFGAEAQQVLRELGRGDPPDPVLMDMATIVETGSAGEGAALAGQMECEPVTALWSALSYPALPAGEPYDADAILRGLSALPPHLRAHLGPILARRLLDAGYEAESARVRRILSRKSETVSPEQELLEAEIALDMAGHEVDEAGSAAAEEEHEIAEAELETIVSKNTELSAEALLRLIRNRLRRDADISYETAQLAGAYATEHRGQPLGAELAGAFLSALAASGAFDEAFAELPRAIEEAGVSADTARSDLVDLLTRHAEDYDFLRHVLSEEDRPGALDAQTANAAAARLLALGFTSEAAGLVAGDAAGSHGRERKLLRAEIALSRGEPRLAEVELLGITGADANLLRAEARSMIGEHEAAQRLFSGVGEVHAARREAWLGSDWQALAEDEDPARSGLARLKLAEPGAEESATQGVLAGDRRLIDQSLDTRAAVQALLEATPVPRE